MAAKDNRGAVIKVGDVVRFVMALPSVGCGETAYISHVWDDDNVEFSLMKSGRKVSYKPGVVEKIDMGALFNACRSKDPIVANACGHVVRNGAWDNLDQEYRDRAVAAGKAGDLVGMAEWMAKSKDLQRLDRFVPSVLNWSALKDFAVGDEVEALRSAVHKKGVKGVVTAVRPDAITVKWSDNGFEATYGIDGNFRNLSGQKKASGDDKLRDEIRKYGCRDSASARKYLMAHRRGITSKYGRDVYDRVFASV